MIAELQHFKILELPSVYVNNSLQWSLRPEDAHACCFFLALRLTTMSVDSDKCVSHEYMLVTCQQHMCVPACMQNVCTKLRMHACTKMPTCVYLIQRTHVQYLVHMCTQSHVMGQYTYVPTHVCKLTRNRTVYLHTHVSLHTHTHTHTHRHTHTQTHTQTHTHTHMHTCVTLHLGSTTSLYMKSPQLVRNNS